MTALRQIEPEALTEAARPVRLGSQLHPDDQAIALASMAPRRLADPDAWLARTVFAVNTTGRLDRRQAKPLAQLRSAPCEPC